MKRFFVVLLFLCSVVFAQQSAPSAPSTVVSDTLLDFSCQPFVGTIYLTLNSTDYRLSRSVNVSSGVFSVSLYPGTYKVVLASSTFGTSKQESWTVRSSGSTQTLANVGSASASIVCNGSSNGNGSSVTGGTCTNQMATAISINGVPTCSTVTSTYVDNSIVTHSAGTLTVGAIAVGNGLGDIKASVVSVDEAGVLNSPNGFKSGGNWSGAGVWSGLTSGGAGFGVNDVAGSSILYLLPSTNLTAGQFWQDSGTVTCPTLATGMPTVCHQLIGTTTLPNPSASTLGGIQSVAAVSHNYIDSISTLGVPHVSQPGYGDIAATGTVPASVMPNPSTSTLGGVQSLDCTGTGHILKISTAGVPSCSADAGGSTFDPLDMTIDWKREHFTNGNITNLNIGSTGMSFANITGAPTFAYQPGIQNHPGILRGTTGSTTVADWGFTLNFGNATNSVTGMDAATWVNYDWDFYAVVALGTNGTGLTSNGFSVGIGSSKDLATTAALQWQVRYNTTAGDTNFMYVVCNATGATGCDNPTPGVAAASNVIDSTVTPVAGTYYQSHIYRRKVGVGGNPTVYMQINAGTPLTFCSSGCTTTLAHEPTTGGAVPHIQYWSHASTTAARSIDMDFIGYKITGLQLY